MAKTPAPADTAAANKPKAKPDFPEGKIHPAQTVILEDHTKKKGGK